MAIPFLDTVSNPFCALLKFCSYHLRLPIIHDASPHPNQTKAGHLLSKILGLVPFTLLS